MGAWGSTASSEAADAVLTVDHLGRLGEAATLARRTRRIALQSMLAGMGLSLAAMGVAAAGFLPAVWGALLQEGIDVAVILNALRALRPVPAARPRGPPAAPGREAPGRQGARPAPRGDVAAGERRGGGPVPGADRAARRGRPPRPHEQGARRDCLPDRPPRPAHRGHRRPHS